jgi:hypothetical protein
MTSKIGILYGRKDHWSEEPQGGVYEKEKDGYFSDHKYEGEIENDKPNGNGTWTQMDGATYVGQFVDGRREGLGTFTWSDKAANGQNSYEGEWVNNRKHGKGKFTYAPDPKTGFEGSVDEGNWIDNKQVLEDDWWKEGGKDYTEEELQKRVDEIEKGEIEYSKKKDKDTFY